MQFRSFYDRAQTNYTESASDLYILVSWFTAMIWTSHLQTEPRASASGFGCGSADLYYYPSGSSSRFVGQAILPAAAFQAALGCGYAALWCWPVCNRLLPPGPPNRPAASYNKYSAI